MKIIYEETGKEIIVDDFLISKISIVIKNIIKKQENHCIIIKELFGEENVEFVFIDLLSYPFYKHQTLDDLSKKLQLENISEIIRYYQMKNMMYLLYDIINHSSINYYNIIEFCKLKQFFSIDKIIIEPFKPFIREFLLIQLLEKDINMKELDIHTREDIIDLMLSKIEKVYYPCDNTRYCIEL